MAQLNKFIVLHSRKAGRVFLQKQLMRDLLDGKISNTMTATKFSRIIEKYRKKGLEPRLTGYQSMQTIPGVVEITPIKVEHDMEIKIDGTLKPEALRKLSAGSVIMNIEAVGTFKGWVRGWTHQLNPNFPDKTITTIVFSRWVPVSTETEPVKKRKQK